MSVKENDTSIYIMYCFWGSFLSFIPFFVEKGNKLKLFEKNSPIYLFFLMECLYKLTDSIQHLSLLSCDPFHRRKRVRLLTILSHITGKGGPQIWVIFLKIAGKLLYKFVFVCYRYDDTFSDFTEHMLNEDLIQTINSVYEHNL